MIRIATIILCLVIGSQLSQAQVKLGDNPNTIHEDALLEMEDTTKGLLLPRMTTSQRDSISSPPNGLKVYNITTNTVDVYRKDQWESTEYEDPKNQLVYVYSTDDLPSAAGGKITLDGDKTYIFQGTIDISPNHIDLNGASVRGFDPSTDGVMSTVTGGVLRSSAQDVYIEDLVVIPASSDTKAYDFSDSTGTKFCNIFAGASVVEVGIPSLGVGQISGFKAITLSKNYWNCTDGIKVTDTVGKFTSSYTFITNISSGAGIEFLSDLVINDIDLSNNYFIYSGQTGVKVNTGAEIDRGRLTTNMFRGVGTYLDGMDSYTPGWYMSQNTNVPDSRAFGYLYMNDNATSTSTSPDDTYVKIDGTTTATELQKWSSPSSNRLTYTGKRDITAKVFITIAGVSPANSAKFTMALAKNGNAIDAPRQSTAALDNKENFKLVMETEVDMTTDDYIEVFIKTTTDDSPVTIPALQFRVSN